MYEITYNENLIACMFLNIFQVLQIFKNTNVKGKKMQPCPSKLNTALVKGTSRGEHSA